MSTTAPVHVGTTELADPIDVNAPQFIHAHGGHPMDCPDFGVVGYDVIRSSWPARELVAAGHFAHRSRLQVIAYVEGGTNYGRAIELFRPLQDEGPNVYGYASPRYACGCRAIADALRPVGTYPAPEFIDLPPWEQPPAAA